MQPCNEICLEIDRTMYRFQAPCIVVPITDEWLQDCINVLMFTGCYQISPGTCTTPNPTSEWGKVLLHVVTLVHGFAPPQIQLLGCISFCYKWGQISWRTWTTIQLRCCENFGPCSTHINHSWVMITIWGYYTNRLAHILVAGETCPWLISLDNYRLTTFGSIGWNAENEPFLTQKECLTWALMAP